MSVPSGLLRLGGVDTSDGDGFKSQKWFGELHLHKRSLYKSRARGDLQAEINVNPRIL